MGEIMEIGRDVALMRFSQHMQEKLQENNHKRGWEDLSAKQLLRRLRTEVRELEKALDSRVLRPREIAREAADVANFAFMIADNFGDLR